MSTWRPIGARLWRPGQVTEAQRAEIEALIAYGIAARRDAAESHAERPDAAGIRSSAPVAVRPAAAVLARPVTAIDD